MSLKKFQSLLREKLGIDEESIKEDLKQEVKSEIVSDFNESIKEHEKYFETLVDSLRGQREIKKSRDVIKTEKESQDLSSLKRELESLEKRLEEH